ANFGGTTYNWAGMPNSVTAANTSVATLCYQAGVSVSMDYDPEGSGAYSTDVPGALTSYFRYASSAQYKNKSSYTTDAWDTLMRGELDNGRPIYYSGSGPTGGHAFILDGYTGTNSFHLNWGWDGWYNGYFTLAALNPGGDTFNNGQAAVIGITPGSANFTLSEGFEGTTFPPTGWSLPVAGFARSATNYITGAYSARYNATATGASQSGKQLRTTKVTVGATSPALVFKARAGATARSEKIKVGYSTTGTAPFTYFGTNASLTNSAQTFTYATNTLTPGDYYFVFETYCSLSTSQNRAWIIDEVTGPALWVSPTPTAALNITSWDAGALAPGDASYSGNTFQLSNTTGGTLTITSVTDLSGTEYKTNLNSAVTLVAGQVHEFGFSYEPINYGSDPQSFVITTNGGTLAINLSGNALSSVFSDGFEGYSDFVVSFPPWSTYSVDTGTVGGISGVTFTNSSTMTSWIVFNPANTTPATGAATPHIGAKYAMSMYNQSAVPNNDWLISPALTLAGSPSLSFWAMSYSSSYLETFKVYYSTTNTTVPGSFTLLATQASVPNAWTNYTYSLPAACANQPTVYLAIVNASTDMFMLMIDDVSVSDSSSPGTPYFGNVSGYVYRQGTTTPIVGATVTAGTKVVTSDANGFYQLNNLLVGTHTLACSATGQFYFDSSQSGVDVTNGNTTTQNLYLTWAELSANPQTISASLYPDETSDINLAISNPSGTADLEYELWLTTSTRGNRRIVDQFNKKPSLSADTHIIENLPIQHQSDRTEGWMGYTNYDDADTYLTAATTNREKATKFTIEDFGMWSSGVTISKLRALFYQPSDATWGTATNFYFKIYGPTGTGTALYTSPTYTATSLVDIEDVLATPLTISTNFYVSVYCVTNGGMPHLVGSTASYGNSYYGASSAAWTAASGFDWCIDAYTTGNEWIRATSYADTVAPAATV
ncbi:MAG: C10 family peptidase, partial [Candidatus Cloacimonetes bacterium]|nr:C10 family peptidase [Candidatus Cloacimonadota bacterium]